MIGDLGVDIPSKSKAALANLAGNVGVLGTATDTDEGTRLPEFSSKANC